jgi:two-component sensor histidine kinase
MERHGIQTILYIPLRVGEQLIGYVELWETRQRREFTPDEINLCQSIARQAAITLENAQLYEQAQREIGERRWAEEQLRASLKEKEVLLQEIHHRVKNNLQIISSMLSLQSMYTGDEGSVAALRESQSRVRSMALIHERLYRSADLARIDFAEYMHSLMDHLYRSYGANPDTIAIRISADGVVMDTDMAIPCGLIVNELVSNALKHAFPPVGMDSDSSSRGEIQVIVQKGKDASETVLTVSDNGAGLPKGLDFRNVESLGLQLVNTLVKQLDGTIELDRDGGTTFRITFGDQGSL